MRSVTAADVPMSLRSAARKVRDRSTDTVRRLQLRHGLVRLDRIMRDGRRPGPLLLRQLLHGWANEAWSASTGFLEAAVEWFERTRGPALECGSGLTTLVLATAASASGRTLLSLEHERAWAARTRAALPPDVRGAVTIADVPIRSYGSFDWYGLEDCTVPQGIGFILCDGPPGSTRGGRYGLAPVLGRRRLAPGCILLLDDTQRTEEHTIAQRWCEELGASIVHEASTYTVLRVAGGEPLPRAAGGAVGAVPRPPAAAAGRAATADGLPILALAPNEWEGLWMNRQHLLSRLAAHHPVLYSTGARSTWDREFLSLGRGGLFGRFSRHDGVVVDQPPLLPFRAPQLPVLDRAAIRYQARRWRRRLARFGQTQLIAYLFHPDYEVFLDALRPDFLVYHAYDLLSLMPSWNSVLESRLVRILQRADLVIASSRVIAAALEERAGRALCIVPNGVDFEAFAHPMGPEPADIAALPRPRIAHVGRLNPKVDIALVSALARRHPEWSFALVGPVVDLDTETAALYASARDIPNLHLLGPKPREELPRYLQAIDVGLLAYRTGVLWTEGIYPLKLHEYLASGLPIVSAGIPAVSEFADVVRVAATLDEWSAAIRAALADTAPEQRSRRVKTAQANSWDGRAATIESLLQTVIAARVPTPAPRLAARAT